MAEDLDAIVWRRATRCGNHTCVEIAQTADAILVRDSKHPCGERLKFGAADWRAFITGLRTGSLVAPS
ncbi:DUF397 domain-containing protein [Dactylosporangium sp. CA-092794]|uniref:DUF397 domain-containing protein n=1 Tax=Dactylosporangium sp. CA-092794 TaxID=3239929 RepID=UPI003D8A2166